MFFTIFGHLTHKAASIEKNQFYLQWFLWWFIIPCCTGKYSGHKVWKDSPWFWWLLCATLVGALASPLYWWWGVSYGWCLILCPLGILDICTFSRSLSHLVFWILLSLFFFKSDFFSSAGLGAVSLGGSFFGLISLMKLLLSAYFGSIATWCASPYISHTSSDHKTLFPKSSLVVSQVLHPRI